MNMTELHRQAIALADRATLEAIKGNRDSARSLYGEAFVLERQAAAEALQARIGEPTTSVLHRSAATLALDAGNPREAERLVATALTLDAPEPIANELRDLLEQIYFHRHLSLRGLQLNPGEFQLALTGRAVGLGIVSSSEFVDRVQTVETLLYRTAERTLNRPFRERGRRKEALQKEIDVYVSVPRAASFAITFKIGSSPQLPFDTMNFADDLIGEVFTCVEMLDHGDDAALRERMREPAYFRNFIGLASKIAPDGDNITGVGFTAVSAGSTKEVALRRTRNALPLPVPPSEDQALASGQPVSITGRLEYASKLKQRNEIRIETDKGSVYKVRVPEGMMNDIVKPLWDERVTVRGTPEADDVLVLVSIEPADDSGGG